MTVKQLIDELSQLDPDLHVFTKGYEGGYEDAHVGKVNNFILNTYKEWWNGPHEIIYEESTNKETVKGIIL